MLNFPWISRKTDDSFTIHVTIDIAADAPKINGNELRDIIYNQAKTYQKLGDHTVSLNEFSLTNLEGKLTCKLTLTLQDNGYTE